MAKKTTISVVLPFTLLLTSPSELSNDLLAQYRASSAVKKIRRKWDSTTSRKAFCKAVKDALSGTATSEDFRKEVLQRLSAKISNFEHKRKEEKSKKERAKVEKKAKKGKKGKVKTETIKPDLSNESLDKWAKGRHRSIVELRRRRLIQEMNKLQDEINELSDEEVLEILQEVNG